MKPARAAWPAIEPPGGPATAANRTTTGTGPGNDRADPRVSATVRRTVPRRNVTPIRDPGGWDLTASSSTVALPIGWPANRTITSPGRRPACAAGPPGVTERVPLACAGTIWAPAPVKLVLMSAPRTACAARPVRMSSVATSRA
jgi:hypothetical protein